MRPSVTHIATEWPSGGGEMGARVRSLDWASTPLGPVETWPVRLRYAVETVLACPYAAAVVWGTELQPICNDGFSRVLGNWRPQAPERGLTQAILAWRDRVFATGEPLMVEDRVFALPGPDGSDVPRRFSGGCTPLKDDAGRVLGFIVSLIETADRHPGDRHSGDRHPSDMDERAHAEAALRESEARLTAAFDSIPLGAAVIGLDGVSRLANAEFRRFVPGRTMAPRDPGDSSAWRAWDAHGDPVSPHDYPGAKALRGEKVVPGLEMLHTDDEGRETWTSVAAVPTFDEAGSVTGFVAIVGDIDAQKRAVDELHSSEEKQRTLLEGIPQLVWRSANDGRWKWSSPQWQRFTGQAPHQALDLGWLDAVHPADRELSIRAWRRATASGVLDVEHRLRHAADGQFRWHHTRSLPVSDRAGRILEWLGTSTDIEDLKRSEAARIAAEDRFKLFARNVQEYALVQTDPGGLVTDWNPGAERLFGFTAGQMVGESFGALFTPEDDAAQVFPRELAFVADGFTNEDARWFVRGDGTQFWARSITEPIYDEGGGFKGLAKVMRDETERERALAFTREALADKEALLKEVHHRVKNNLQVVISLLNLQSKRLADERLLPVLEESRNRVQAIASIHELIYRAGSFASVALSTYARRLAQDLVTFYGLRDRVTLEVVGDGATLELERAVPFGMLLNELISNACKHAYTGRQTGLLKIAFTEDGDAVELAVTDDGPGLPAEVDYRTTSSLGLKLVQGLVRQLGGTLNVATGAGTTVKVRFAAPVRPAMDA